LNGLLNYSCRLVYTRCNRCLFDPCERTYARIGRIRPIKLLAGGHNDPRYPPVVHRHDPVAERVGLRAIVRNQQDAEGLLFAEGVEAFQPGLFYGASSIDVGSSAMIR
jgi:hypothetical protein